jgi:hypothetical protein
MHSCVFVITTDGADPAGLMLGRHLGGWGPVDWAAAGGRFSGLLQPKPGATTAKVFGDALPSFEADMIGMIADIDPEVSAERAGRLVLGGVDQLALHELDAATVLPGYLLTPDGEIHSDGWTSKESIVARAELTGEELFGFTPAELADIKRSLHEKSDAWDRLVDQLLATWAAHGATLTVVDVHT